MELWREGNGTAWLVPKLHNSSQHGWFAGTDLNVNVFPTKSETNPAFLPCCNSNCLSSSLCKDVQDFSTVIEELVYFPQHLGFSVADLKVSSVSDRGCCCLWRNSVLIALSGREWQAQRIKDKNINLTTSSPGATSPLPADKNVRLKRGGRIYWKQVYEE